MLWYCLQSDEYDYLPAEWESVVIGTPADPAYCDISFSLGVEYVVFGKNDVQHYPDVMATEIAGNSTVSSTACIG